MKTTVHLIIYNDTCIASCYRIDLDWKGIKDKQAHVLGQVIKECTSLVKLR